MNVLEWRGGCRGPEAAGSRTGRERQGARRSIEGLAEIMHDAMERQPGPMRVVVVSTAPMRAGMSTSASDRPLRIARSPSHFP